MRGLKQPLQGAADSKFRSHASRVRGLKRLPGYRYHYRFRVARFPRAWIETLLGDNPKAIGGSHASRVRGLKQNPGEYKLAKVCVARFPRAWIETIRRVSRSSAFFVARFPRAWIET